MRKRNGLTRKLSAIILTSVMAVSMLSGCGSNAAQTPEKEAEVKEETVVSEEAVSQEEPVE